MTSIDYTTIFESFLGYVTDYNLASLSISDSYAIMKDYLRMALSESYVRRLFSSIKIDDEIQIINFEMALSLDEEADKDFVITCLSKWMVYEWLHNQVQNIVNTHEMFSNKDQKWFSQAAHLAELRALQSDAYKEARSFIGDRGFINNSYLRGN